MLAIALKYLLPVVAVIGLLFGTYEYGHSKGYDTGYASGHQIAWDTQQQAINKMVATENAERTDTNNKITALEANAAQDASDLFAAKAAVASTRETIVTQYQTANPTTAAECGWDAPTVTTINQILSADTN